MRFARVPSRSVKSAPLCTTILPNLCDQREFGRPKLCMVVVPTVCDDADACFPNYGTVVPADGL